MSVETELPFGHQVRAARDAQRLPRYVVAFRAGTTYRWLRLIEEGREDASPALRRALQDTLGLDPDPDPEPAPVTLPVPVPPQPPADAALLDRINTIGDERRAINRQLSGARDWHVSHDTLVAQRAALDQEEERLWAEVRRVRATVRETRAA